MTKNGNRKYVAYSSNNLTETYIFTTPLLFLFFFGVFSESKCMFFIINRDAHETNDFQYNIDLYYMHAFNLVYARALFWCVQAIYTHKF